MNKDLPLGTVVKLKNENNKVMISGVYCRQGKKMYKYIGVLYPYGSMSEELVLYFNDEDIEEIIFIGNTNYKGEK